MKKIVFIESNTTGTGQLFISKAIEKGYEILFLAADVERYAFLAELMIVPIRIDTSNPHDIITYLNNVNHIEAVFSSSEYFIETASYVAKYLGLACNNVDAIRACRDKLILSQKLIAAGVHTPQSHLIISNAAAEKHLNYISFPVVLKPASGSGSIGVKRCDTKQDYCDHVNQLLLIDTNERGVKITPRVLVQEYIQGPEYSVEVIAVNSIYHIVGITQKYLGSEPFFVEIGHDFPAVLNTELEQKINNSVILAMSIMGLTLGAAHVEIRLSNNNVYIIEINPRLAGGMIPALIQESLGIDILELILDLHCGKKIIINPRLNRYSSIRFILPELAGTIKKIEQHKSINEIVGVKLFSLTKKIGEKTTTLGDYRDRIGFVITSANNINESRQIAMEALNALTIKIDNEQINSQSNTGRLNQSLHPEALAIINQQSVDAILWKELELFTAIDEAHLIMLMKQGILSIDTIKKVLTEISLIKKDNFSTFKGRDVLRGSYLLYENGLIERLGMETGGVIHTGRSRNDINATVFKLTTRELYQKIYSGIWKLRYIILQQAEKYSDISMPIYSQFQPALPGNYSFYLLAIEHAIARDQAAVKVIYEQLAVCPLGSGAGCGTSFPINQTITAQLLGFESSASNALDAVAARDMAVRLLSCLSILGMTLSRIAQDYQIWTTQEFAFFDLPDMLVGGSSMLPQKKNPYLLEKIKGKAIAPLGQLMSSLAIMQKTPFSNSVEVGTEALVDFDKSFKSIDDATHLLYLIIAHAKPIVENMQISSTKGLTSALCIAEALTKLGAPFREAHYKVGDAISVAIKNKSNPETAMHQLLPYPIENNTRWSETFNYGGGCATFSIRKQMDDAILQLQNDGTWMQKIIAFWNESNILRSLEVNKILYSTN